MLGLSRWRAAKLVWYQRVRPRWLDVRPLVLALATVAVFVFGTIGFQRYEVGLGRHPLLLDSFYRTLTLFELDGYDVEPPIPWPMELARFLAPVIVGYAVFRGLAAVFHQQLQLAGIRLLTRDHVVIAGLGGMGFRLARAFREQGFRVIVVEIDPSHGSIQGCHERGIIVLSGDARDYRMLAKARAEYARYLVAVCGGDATNVEVGVAAGKLASTRPRGSLHTLVHLADPGLWRMLKAEAITRLGHQSMRLEFFYGKQQPAIGGQRQGALGVH